VSVSRFLTAHQHNSAIQCHSRWFTLENIGQKTNWKYRQYGNQTQPRKRKQCKIQQEKTTLVQSLLTTFGQETKWALSTHSRAHTGQF